MTDQELKDLVANLAVSQARTDAQIAASTAKFDAQMEKSKAENDKGFAEMRAQSAKTEAQLEKSKAENDKGFAELRAQSEKSKAENDKGFAELRAQSAKYEAQSAKNEATMTRIAKEFGGFTNNMGYITESYFYDCLVENPVLNGIKFDEIQKNIRIKTKHNEDEFDLVLYNGDSIALIECKYKIHKADIEKFDAQKIQRFKNTFLDYADYKYYLGVASNVFYPEAEQYAIDQGYIIIKPKGDFIEINTDNVRVY